MSVGSVSSYLVTDTASATSIARLAKMTALSIRDVRESASV